MPNPTPEPHLTLPQNSLPPPPPARRRRWVPLALVGVAALLVGAAIATVTVLAVNAGAQQHRYDVTVFLAHDTTAAQKNAIRTALNRLHPVDGIQFEDRQQAYAKFQEMFKDHPDLLTSTKPDSLPESFRLATSATEFDCPALNNIRRLPGVDDVVVVQPAVHGHPGAKVTC
jgi:cell division transport system permease protein